MEDELNKIIHDKLMQLIDFVLEKNPNVKRVDINRKTKELNLRITAKNTQKVVNTIIDQKSIIKVHKSQFSNYVLFLDDNDHFDDLKKYKLVMDINTHTITGTENSNGSIEPLTKEQIEMCHKYKIKYEVPLNLNTSDEPDQDNVIANEMHGLGLNHAESESEEEEEEED